MTTQNQDQYPVRRTCCPCGHDHSAGEISRRGFLQGVGGAAALGVALTGLTWSGVSAAEQEDQGQLKRRPLVVKPIQHAATAAAMELALLGRYPDGAGRQAGSCSYST